MIGGKRHDHRIAAAPNREHRTRRDRRAGIAPHRLQYDIGLDADRRELLGD